MFKHLCEPLCLCWTARCHQGYRKAWAESGEFIRGQQCPVLDWGAGTPFPRCTLAGAVHNLVLALCPERHPGGCQSVDICHGYFSGLARYRKHFPRGFVRDEGPIAGCHQKSHGVVNIDARSSFSGHTCLLCPSLGSLCGPQSCLWKPEKPENSLRG